MFFERGMQENFFSESNGVFWLMTPLHRTDFSPFSYNFQSHLQAYIKMLCRIIFFRFIIFLMAALTRHPSVNISSQMFWSINKLETIYIITELGFRQVSRSLGQLFHGSFLAECLARSFWNLQYVHLNKCNLRCQQH